MSNILIIKHGSLGDIAQASGVIQDISDNHKNDKLYLLTTKPYIDLFKKNPFITDVILDKRLSRFNLIYLYSLMRSIKKLDIQKVYDLQNSSRTKFYQRIFFPNSSSSKWSSSETTLPRDKTKERLQNLHQIYSNFDQTIVVNVGIAGGNPDQTKIGELYRVNSIFDEKTKQCFIPDILCKHPLLELSLTTVTNSVNNNGDDFTGLVDMEGSVIFQQMSRHVSIHRLIFLKLVSDHMDIDDRQRIIDVTGLIAKKIDLIKSILLSLDHHVLTNNVILSDKEFDIIQRGVAQLNLTDTQVYQLMEWTENYVKLTGNDLDKLAPFFIKKSNSKKERNQIFESIREFLSA